MTFTPTNRPVPSDAPEDLYFNSSTLDSLVNGPVGTPVVDRTGVPRKNWATIEAENAGLASDLAGPNGTDFIFYKSPLPGAVKVALTQYVGDSVSVKSFGAIADGTFHPLSEFFDTVEEAQFQYPDVIVDSLSRSVDYFALVQGDISTKRAGKLLWNPEGVYICDDGIHKQGTWNCAGNTRLGPYPIVGDSKEFLRPGYKHLLPGTVFLFVGAGTKSYTTERTDEFSTGRYCILESATGQLLRSASIVQDMDVYTAGGVLTQLGEENASDYEAGHVIFDVPLVHVYDVTVFGYFPQLGTVVFSTSDTADDPDYCQFWGGSTMGRVGFALLGSDTSSGPNVGLSGTQTWGLDIWTLDHHSRGPSTAAAIYANADTWRLILIDGWTSAINAKINGHYFHGGSMRTYARHAMEFKQASQVNFEGVIFEDSVFVGVPNTENKQWLASALTINVAIDKCRFSGDVGLFNPEFGGVMSGQLYVAACPGLGIGNGVLICEKDPANNGSVNWIKFGGASGGTGDPAIQFGSGSPTTSTVGWSLRRRISLGGALAFNFGGVQQASLSTDGLWVPKRVGFPAATVLTVTSNAVTVTQSNHIIDATGSPTVTTINGGVDGELIKLQKTGTGTVTIAEGGNIVVPGTSFALTAITDVINLFKKGSNWVADAAPADNA